MTITQLLHVVTQVLGLALPAGQQFTDFWQTPTVVKRSKGRAHTRSVGTHLSLQWALWLSQTHGYCGFFVSESLLTPVYNLQGNHFGLITNIQIEYGNNDFLHAILATKKE